MSYADITRNDRSAIKRWLQRRRLSSALELGLAAAPAARVICDYGAGDGALSLQLAQCRPQARIICYEPADFLRAEAEATLAQAPEVELSARVDAIAPESVDLLFCLEVFEHLPARETEQAMRSISRLLRPGGTLVIGVPVETGIPALYKGVFRMLRRYGSFDARPDHVLLATLGRPPRGRTLSEIAPGFRFYREHLGFRLRELKAVLRARFHLKRAVACPFAPLGSWLMPEVNLLARKPGRLQEKGDLAVNASSVSFSSNAGWRGARAGAEQNASLFHQLAR
ncbi:methyltransferase [Thiorhodococcus minor]|uniref:Class I SAM-dependent methyltransferase n=1 Tax=Thiorhodococcus minor TaxID=57489 RepID=A0A6M0K555_9GAMM|nr:class I SAM-dependent methyltransferase [Thiorhodococcus minor]